MMDLTKTPPRSVRETMLGIVQLARTIDKAKAVAQGRFGEYRYDCPMDRGLFDFLGMDSQEFLTIVKTARDNAGIEAYAKVFVAKQDAQSIETFNEHWLSDLPTGDSLEAFYELRAKVAPSRTDVTSWPDLLDLEEGRTVPLRR